MSNWGDFKREESGVRTLTGKRRCVVVDAEEGVSKAGNPQIVVWLRPSSGKYTVRHFFTKTGDDEESIRKFNRKLTEFFDAFPGIGFGNFEFVTWGGCEGAAMFGLSDKGFLEVKRFLIPEEVKNLPPYEGDRPERQIITKLEEEEDLDDLPFEI